MTTVPFTHVVLTRFNVRAEFTTGRPPDERWLAHRFRLFDQFAFPSMKHQRAQNFVWLVFLDAETPEKYRQWMAQYALDLPQLQPVYVGQLALGTAVTANILQQTITPLLAPENSHLITTRFDNDDAVSDQFLDTVQAQFNGQPYDIINFPDGFLWRQHRLYTKRNLANPFVSMIETAENFQTIWCKGHHLLKQDPAFRQVEAGPLWIQVIHGRNVLNRVRDGNIRLPLSALPASFHLNIPLHPERERSWEIALENRLKAMKRRLRWRWKQRRKRLKGQ